MEVPSIIKDISVQSKADLTIPNKSCKEDVQKNDYFTLKLCKCYTLKLLKPLVQLKIIYFLWQAMSAVIWTFFIVYLKQEGMTLQQLFLCFTLSPIVQVISMSTFSVLIDKFGHPKVYLISGLLVSGCLMICILHLPSLNEPLCQNDELLLECGNKKWIKQCRIPNILENITHKTHCQIRCSEEMGSVCNGNNLTCLNGTLEKNIILSITRSLNCSENATDSFYFIDGSTGISFLCDFIQYDYCNLNCLTISLNCNTAYTQRNFLAVVYVSIIVAVLTTYVNTYRFLDISAQVLIKRHKADYGHVRMWGSVGTICGPIFAGFFVHLASSGQNINYSPCLYYYSMTCLVSAYVAYKMEICGLDQGKDMWKKSKSLIKTPDILMFYMLLLVLGASWALCTTYRVWYLEELGASSYMFSLLDVLRNICGVILLFKSKWILDKLGERNAFLLALFGYAVYQVSYSFLQTVWPAVFIELIRIFSANFLWVAVIYHCIQIAPKGLTATVASSAGLLHFTIGRFIGGFVGGVLVTNFGGRTTFQIMGLVNLAFAIVYAVYLFYRQKKRIC